MNEISDQDIESQLLLITSDFLHTLAAERALRAITLDASLERDLGIDSLGKVEFFHRIEQAFSIQLPENTIVTAGSLRDLVAIIKQATHTVTTPTKHPIITPTITTAPLNLSTATTLTEVLFNYATKQPQRLHIIFQNDQGEEKAITYGQLFAEATRIASGLSKRGIKPSEAVAIMLPSGEDFFYAFCGTLLAGAIPVPIYPPFRLDRIEEYVKRETKILKNAQARILITFAAAEILSNILQPFVPSLKEVTTIKNLQIQTNTLPELLAQPNDVALIQYTSGSTDDPKGVLLTHQNILTNIRAIEKSIPIKSTDVTVSWLPLYHDMGLMCWLGSLYCGTPLIILSPLTFLARPERWLWAIHYHQATLSGGPNFAYELCAKKINPKAIEGLDLSSWQFAFNGAEKINPNTLEHFSKKFARYGFKAESFAPVYGLAEATVALTFPPKKRSPRIDKIQREVFETEGKAVPTTTQDKNTLEFIACGSVIPGHKIRIVDDNNNELAERSVGNVQFQGPSAMCGYFNNPSATQKAYHDGWWDTGDLGYLADNELFITGRKKDLIIKAGRNIHPEEIENVVNQIPSVRKGCVAAFGVNDPNTGTEKLVVVAEVYNYAEQQQQQTRSEVIKQMAITLDIPPDLVILVAPHSIPKTSSGKLQRSACKQAFLEGKLTSQPLPAKIQLLKLALISFTKKTFLALTYLIKLTYTTYIGIILLLTLPVISLAILLSPYSVAETLIKIYARNFFRLAFCPVTIINKENLPNNKPVIFVANHASYIDALLLTSLLPKGTVFTAKKELLKIPLLNKLIKKLKHITIDRIDFIKSLENKNLIAETVSQGQSVVIFPEATFTYATGLRPFKLGAFAIAAETNTPICPVTIQGTRSILRSNSWLPKPGAIKVAISNLIYPKAKDWNEALRLHAAARNEIAKHCGESVIDVITAGPVIE